MVSQSFLDLFFPSLWNKQSEYYKNERGVHNNIDSVIGGILSRKSKFYQKLPLKSQKKFIDRVGEFIYTKEFIGKNGLEITDEIRILISSAAIQVTFGLEKFLFDGFEKIYVYPENFYSRINKSYHKGEVNLSGAIVFSWEDFKSGFDISNDNFNLGLHEMAHALRFDKFRNPDFDEFFFEYYEKFLAIGRVEFLRIKNGGASYLRNYAGSNAEEFFAVCVEHFFESPEEMKQRLPDLYRHLCILLNQDPIFINSTIQIRQSYFKKLPYNPGRLIFSTGMSHSLLVIPFCIGFFFLFMFFYAQYSQSVVELLTSILPLSVMSLYIGSGGYTLSWRFKKLLIYENCLMVIYPLNPMLGMEVLNFDRLVSATLFNEVNPNLPDNLSDDYLILNYTDGISFREISFSLTGMIKTDVEKITAYLKRNKALIKIVGGKWSHKAITEMEREMMEEVI